MSLCREMASKALLMSIVIKSVRRVFFFAFMPSKFVVWGLLVVCLWIVIVETHVVWEQEGCEVS